MCQLVNVSTGLAITKCSLLKNIHVLFHTTYVAMRYSYYFKQENIQPQSSHIYIYVYIAMYSKNILKTNSNENERDVPVMF